MKHHGRFSRDFLVLAGVLLAIAFAPATGWTAGVHLAINPAHAGIGVGDTILIEATVTPADDEFNGFDLNLGFDPALLAFVPTTPSSDQIGPVMRPAECTNNPFHIFLPGPNQLTITVALLCANTFVKGPGVIYRVKFRALSPGPTSIACNAGSQFYRAGFFVNPLDCTPSSISISSGSGTGVDPGSPPDGTGGLRISPPRPNPSPGYGGATFSLDLPRSETAVLTLFDAAGRLVAGSAPERFVGAGRHDLAWNPGPLTAGVYLVRLTTLESGTRWSRWTIVR